MDVMPRPRPPHLHKETTRHGKTVWYVRLHKETPRIRLRATYGTPAFEDEYQVALTGDSPAKPGKASKGTLSWLVEQYRETTAWSTLSAATRRQRENVFKHVLASAGREPFAKITARTIDKGLDRRKAKPAAARHFLQAMRGLFIWATSAEHVAADPTAGAKAAQTKTKGFPVWTEDDIQAFERRWPLGTRERVMFDIYLYTGLRRGDAAALGKQHVKSGLIMIDTEKTGTRVAIPVLPVLAKTLKAGPVGDLAFIASAIGNPMTKESVGNAFADAARAAGIRKSAHGLRKAAATRAANLGATVAELEAIFGWEGGRMASLYTKDADRQRLARGAMGKLSGTSIPAPSNKVRARGRKDQ